MKEDTKPLVSICVTFFNAERYLRRVIESCLGQTYHNIEVILVDDMSTDGSAQIIQEYVSRDVRVRHCRNEQRIGLPLSFSEMFRRAKGDFVVMVGADDWIAHDFIERGMASFFLHPDAAGIVPALTSLSEISPGRFDLLNETVLTSGVYRSEWFARRMYRPEHLYISALALLRRDDAINIADNFLKHYVHHPKASLPDELKRFFSRGFGIDTIFFLEILPRYDNFVVDSSMRYMKVALFEGQALSFDIKENSFSEIIKYSHVYLAVFDRIYRLRWPKFYWGMKIFLGADAISTSIIAWGQQGLRPSFFRAPFTKERTYSFMREFSFMEATAAAAYAPLRIISRLWEFALRNFFMAHDRESERKRLFTKANFLSAEGLFVSR